MAIKTKNSESVKIKDGECFVDIKPIDVSSFNKIKAQKAPPFPPPFLTMFTYQNANDHFNNVAIQLDPVEIKEIKHFYREEKLQLLIEVDVDFLEALKEQHVKQVTQIK